LRDVQILSNFLKGALDEVQFLESRFQHAGQSIQSALGIPQKVTLPPSSYVEYDVNNGLISFSVNPEFEVLIRAVKTIRSEGHLLLAAQSRPTQSTEQKSQLRGIERYAHYARSLLWLWASERTFYDAWYGIAPQIYDPQWHAYTTRWTSPIAQELIQSLAELTDTAFTEWVEYQGIQQSSMILNDALNTVSCSISLQRDMWFKEIECMQTGKEKTSGIQGLSEMGQDVAQAL
jgi:hypothetical protein